MPAKISVLLVFRFSYICVIAMCKAHRWLCIVPGTRESIEVENVFIAWNNNVVIRKNAIEGGQSGPPLRAGYRKHDFQCKINAPLRNI